MAINETIIILGEDEDMLCDGFCDCCDFQTDYIDEESYGDEDDESLDSVLERVVYKTLEDTVFSDVFDHADFMIRKEFGTCIVISCKLPSGYVVCDSVMIGKSLEDDVTKCLKSIMAKAVQLEEYANIHNDYHDYLDEQDTEYENYNNYECANCEYFYQCFDDEFSDIDIDIDYYD